MTHEDIGILSAWSAQFRRSMPYISTHRHRTFVIHLPGEAIASEGLRELVHDIALTHVLGAKVIVVCGARPQIDQMMIAKGLQRHFVSGKRITNAQAIEELPAIHGQITAKVTAALSTTMSHTIHRGEKIPLVCAQPITAQPLGILDGTDYEFSGRIRRIDTDHLRSTLDHGNLILISPIGYSPSGQLYNLSAHDVAAKIAVDINADKLITLTDIPWLAGTKGERLPSLTPDDLDTLLAPHEANSPLHRLSTLAQSVRAGVPKAQIVSYEHDGALLRELYTAEGSGTQITNAVAQRIRPATVSDIPVIIEIIRPLEQSGILVRRPRPQLEKEISHFLVAELDEVITGCCALFNHQDDEDQALLIELACLAVHPGYRSLQPSVGQRLLIAAQEHARSQGAQAIFVLTTQSSDWFKEHGFDFADPTVLPDNRKSLYNWQRGSKVMIRSL